MRKSGLILSRIKWDNERCEPVLITYNRSHCLEQTLAAFFILKKYNMRFHVLDNCSTDDTRAVVEKWQLIWPELSYHRNAYNIGGNANILRALEITSSEYSWIIGDDDAWHLEHIDSLIHALATQQADIIRLGWLVSKDSTGVRVDAQTLFQQEHYFFASLGMISSTIVRRSMMTAHLPWAYYNISGSYPQLVPCIRAFQEGPLQVYSLSTPLLTHTPSTNVGFFLGDLEWYVAWFKTAQFFTCKSDRKKFVAEVVRYMIRPNVGSFAEFIWLLKVALNAKGQRVSQRAYLVELFLAGDGWRVRLLWLSVLYFLFPQRLARLLRRVYFHMQKKPWKELQYDRTRI